MSSDKHRQWPFTPVPRALTSGVRAAPVTSAPPGAWFWIFGGAAELITVDRDTHPAFPGGRLLMMRPAGGEDRITVLVPADYTPIVWW